MTQENVRYEDGRAFTEFVIIFPLFMLVLFGVIDFSRVFTFNTQLDDAALVAGREAAVLFELKSPSPPLGDHRDELENLFRTTLDRYDFPLGVNVTSWVAAAPTMNVVSSAPCIPPPPPGAPVDVYTLALEINAEIPCITCKFILGTARGFNVERTFHFPIENPDFC